MRAPPASRRAGSSSRASARASGSCAWRSPRTSRRSTSRARRSWTCSPAWPPSRAHRARGAARQPGRGRRHPREDHHRPGAQQIRHRVGATRPPSTPAPPRLPASSRRARGPYRQPDPLRSRPTAPPSPASRNWSRALRAAGLRVTTVDCGGGLGIGYRDEAEGSPAALAGAIRAALGGLGVRVMVEPGRWLAGPAGVLLASVVLVKRDRETRFVVLDAAMNDLVRPSMYDAWHGIVPVSAVEAVAPAVPRGYRRPGLRDGRHIRAKPDAAAACAERARGDSGRGRIWFGHELDLQRAPAGGRGDGGWREVVRHPRPAAARGTCGRASAYRSGCNRPERDDDRRRDRAPASPSAKPAHARAARDPVRARSGRRSGRRSASPACSSASPCWTSRACCRPGRIRHCSPPRRCRPGPAVRGLLRVGVPDDRAADRRLEVASGLRHRPLSVLTDRPALPGDAAERSGRRISPARSPGAPAAYRPAASGAGPLRPAGVARRARGRRSSPRWRSPGPMRRRGWRAPWSRTGRPRPPRPRPSSRPGSRRPPIRGSRRCSSRPRAAR